jgi:hypothetical protein
MSIFHDVETDDDTRERLEAALPDHAVETIQRLQEIADQRTAIALRLSEKQRAETEKRRRMENEVAQYERAIFDGEYPTTELNARNEKLKRRIAESLARTVALSKPQKLEPTLLPYRVFEDLIGLPRDIILTDARVSVTVATSDDLSKRVAASRKLIATLTSKRGAVRRALLPKEVAIHGAVSAIKRAAAEGAPDFSPNARLVSPSITSRPRQGKTAWPMLSLETGHHLIDMVDTAALMMFALQDQLIAAATVSISKLYEENPLVVPESERKARMDEIDEQILAEARVEEALIEEAEARGLEILRRPDAPPLAVLGVAIAPAAPAEKSEAKETEFG